MRSRYAAFAMLNEPYLLATWHPARRPKSVQLDAATKWLGLKIVSAAGAGDDAGTVEFIARFRVGGGSASRLHERSRFVREGGRWYYVDGEFA
jgi:SEC-C motif-containing protein